MFTLTFYCLIQDAIDTVGRYFLILKAAEKADMQLYEL